MCDTTKFNELFLKYQKIYNLETGKNMVFSGSFDCSKNDNLYYLLIRFVGRENGSVVYNSSKNYVISEEYIKTTTDKSVRVDNIYFKNIIDDLDLICILSSE